MAQIRSNRPQVTRSLHDLSQALNLRRRTSGGKTLGSEIAETTAVAIETRTIDRQQDSAGGPLAELSERWAGYKASHGFPATIGVMKHEMLDLEELIGETTITRDTLVMEYGLGDETRAKAESFQEGGSNKPPRPFYDVGKDGEAAVDELIRETLDNALRAAMGQGAVLASV